MLQAECVVYVVSELLVREQNKSALAVIRATAEKAEQ